MPVCPKCRYRNQQLGAKCSRCEKAYNVDDDALEWVDRGDPYLGRRVIDKYVIVGRISEGAMGTVYRAVQLPVDRPVALKVLRTDVEDDEETGRRFLREARAVSQLNHPHIVTLYDFGFDGDGRPYMAMEYVEGEQLGEWIYRDNLRLPNILRVLRQILEALAEAHARGIIHRDLKPDNIVVAGADESDEEIKLLDFGIARLVNNQSGEGLTREGHVYGTPHYMSPEQASGKIDIGPEADVYAVGILLYEMLAGRIPFEADDPLAILRMHADEPLPKLQPRDGLTVPTQLEKLLERATRKDPADRFATAGEMLEVFEQFDDPERSGILEAARLAQVDDEAETVTAEESPLDEPAEPAQPPQLPETVERSSPAVDGSQSFREVEPEVIGEEEAEEADYDLDWERYSEHNDPDADSAGKRRGAHVTVIQRVGRFGLDVGLALAACVVGLVGFVLLTAQYHEWSTTGRVVVGVTPIMIAAFFGAMAQHQRFRRFLRAVITLGFFGVLSAHFPDPERLGRALTSDPVWFLERYSGAPGVEQLAEWVGWFGRTYGELLRSLFG